MTAYVLRRLASALLTLLGVAVILFVLFRLMPGDPAAQVISPALDEAAQARLKQAFGLDLPLWQQFVVYMKNLATFEWGRSFSTGQPVANLLGHWLVNTLLLMTAGLVIAITLGIVLGIFMSARRGGALDFGATVQNLARARGLSGKASSSVPADLRRTSSRRCRARYPPLALSIGPPSCVCSPSQS